MFFFCCGSASFLVVVENSYKDGFTLRNIWGKKRSINYTFCFHMRGFMSG